MKKTSLTLSILLILFAGGVYAETYTMYGKDFFDQWVKIKTYKDFAACENSRKGQEFWYKETRCVAD